MYPTSRRKTVNRLNGPFRKLNWWRRSGYEILICIECLICEERVSRALCKQLQHRERVHNLAGTRTLSPFLTSFHPNHPPYHSFTKHCVRFVALNRGINYFRRTESLLNEWLIIRCVRSQTNTLRQWVNVTGSKCSGTL